VFDLTPDERSVVPAAHGDRLRDLTLELADDPLVVDRPHAKGDLTASALPVRRSHCHGPQDVAEAHAEWNLDEGVYERRGHLVVSELHVVQVDLGHSVLRRHVG